jgi:hypothetical protein
VAIAYTLVAIGVVPGLLGLFHWLSRVPAAPAPEEKQKPVEGVHPVSLAEEAERWLQSQI